MLNGIVSGAEKAITRIPMQVGGVYKEGWEVRDSQDRIIWGREDELQTVTGTLPFKGYGLPAKVKSLLGNTQQTGTPTPDAPIMPELVGVRTAQNIHFPYSSGSQELDGIVWTMYPDGELTGKGTSTKGTNYYIMNRGSFPLKAGTYTLSWQGDKSINLILRNVTAAENIANIGGFSKSVTFTVMNDIPETDQISLYFNTSVSGTSVDIDGYPMLNFGSTPLPYEPYGYKIPITNAGQTTPVYLGEVPTVRRIKKRVFDGTENWTMWEYQTAVMFYTPVADGTELLIVSSHFGTRKTGSMPLTGNVAYNGNSNKNMLFRMLDDTTITTVEGFKAYLAAQYAAGTPVTVWYVLAEPTTGIVNEPLAKIGDYADELNGIVATLPEIPTTTGQNTLTVDTTLAPSEMTVKGHIKLLS